MASIIIPPDHHLRERLEIGKRGYLDFHVAADHPLNTYVLDEYNLQLYEDHKAFRMVGGFHRCKLHDQRLLLPSEDDWYLIIENDSDQDIEVEANYYSR